MKRYINFILVFVAVAALIVATLEYKRMLAVAKINNDAAAAVLKRNAIMQARLNEMKQEFPQLAADTGGGNADSNATAMLAVKNKAAKEQAVRQKDFDQAVAQFNADAKTLAERLKTDHEFALKYYAALRAQADIMNAPFSRIQHLSREQSDALADARFQRMLRTENMQAGRQFNEDDVDSQTVKDANDEFLSNVKSALGDDLYDKFLVYQRQGEAWDAVNGYGKDMSLAGIPLSLEQSSQLADAISNASPAFQNGKNVNITTVDWDAVNAAAVDILTPEQMDFFKKTTVRGDIYGWIRSPQMQEWIDEIQKQAQ